MNGSDFLDIITGAQIATALTVIAVSLAFIAMKLYERSPRPSK